MARFWQQILKGERGQALPVVLVLLVLGGLLITPTLSYATTSLNAVQITKQNIKGVYAADAGVEHVLWCIKNFEELPEALPYTGDPINGMEVAMETEDWGPYTIAYYTQIVNVSESDHFTFLSVEGDIEWVEEDEVYKYTITATRQPEATGNIKLKEMGARLPVGYSYEPGSVEDFPENFSPEEPAEDEDDAGAQLLGWVYAKPPLPEVSEAEPVATQTFYITGEGELDGDYAWVVADRSDIGIVGEFSGILYRITATATLPGDGEITAKVMTDVIFNENTEELLILLWQTTKEQDDD